MKIIKVGNTFRTYDDSLETFDKLPAQNYVVRFQKNSGFFLEKYADIEIKEKTYGVHMSKVEKVLKAFSRTKKNLGVILSGNKGIGKSLFAKTLAVEATKTGLPVIIVDTYIPGIASFIEEIEQEVMILFDEFDKTFGSIKAADGMADPQTEMLTLFDGLSQGKKMFVITCNDLNSLNSYLVNRPGRFHYHFRFEYPSDAEITEYLEDKLDRQYYSEIEKVISFAHKVDLNYDCLRAIAFELNYGEPFEIAIKDLNIINLNSIMYEVILHLEDGSEASTKLAIDFFDKSAMIEPEFCFKGTYVDASCKVLDCEFDHKKGIIYVSGNDIKLENDNYYNDEEDEKIIKAMKPAYMTFIRSKSKELHYAV